MKLAFIADLHLDNHRAFGGPPVSGLNNRARLCIDALHRAVDDVAEQGADGLYVLGDIFDTIKPIPQLVTAVQNALWGVTPTRLMVGNHDLNSSSYGDHSLGPLASPGSIVHEEIPATTVIEQPRVDEVACGAGQVQVWVVPYRTGAARAWLPQVLAELEAINAGGSPTKRVLCLHLGIYDTSFSMPWMRAADDAINVEELFLLCEQYSISFVFAGNWHTRRMWSKADMTIVQVGALIPTGWDNSGLNGYGSVAYLEGAEPDQLQIRVKVVPGPRFVTVQSSTDIDTLSSHAVPGDSFFVKVLPGKGTDAATLAAEAERKFAPHYGGHIVSASATRSVGVSAVDFSARSLEEAAAEYVETELALPPSLDTPLGRERILAEVLRLMS